MGRRVRGDPATPEYAPLEYARPPVGHTPLGLRLQPGRPPQPGGQDHQEAAPAAMNPAACDAYCWARRTPTRSMPGRGSRHWRSLTSGWHCN